MHLPNYWHLSGLWAHILEPRRAAAYISIIWLADASSARYIYTLDVYGLRPFRSGGKMGSEDTQKSGIIRLLAASLWHESAHLLYTEQFTIYPATEHEFAIP